MGQGYMRIYQRCSFSGGLRGNAIIDPLMTKPTRSTKPSISAFLYVLLVQSSFSEARKGRCGSWTRRPQGASPIGTQRTRREGERTPARMIHELWFLRALIFCYRTQPHFFSAFCIRVHLICILLFCIGLHILLYILSSCTCVCCEALQLKRTLFLFRCIFKGVFINFLLTKCKGHITGFTVCSQHTHTPTHTPTHTHTHTDR